MKQYDYIICGGGGAGLTFLYEILLYKNLNNKKILVIDHTIKNKNDRTWCFWETDNNLLENLVCHSWQQLQFKTNDFATTLNINPYKYKQIKSVDFYNYIIQFAAQFENITFITEHILSIKNENNIGCVATNISTYYGNYIFNTTFLNIDAKKINTPNSLLQHFKGIVIETPSPIFNSQQATFMDFSICQNKGTAFMYMLPTSPTKALIEYTLFTKNILQQNEYDEALKNYIDSLNINDYKITHTEFGIIPMTDYNFKLYDNKIINIGAAGGCIKASTGFAFKNIQQQVKQIAALLNNNKKPYLKQNFTNKKFVFYDAILLEVIAQNKMKAADIFAAIFKKNKPQLVLKFLENKTTLFEDFKILNSVPTKIFLPIAIKKIVGF